MTITRFKAALVAIALCLFVVLSVRTFAELIDVKQIYTAHAAQLPVGASDDNLLLFGHLYTLSLNPKTKFADWVAFRAREVDAASRNSIARNWLHALPDQTLESSDYRGPEYDIGHLAPLATFKASQFAYELNFLGNCAPQTPNLNRGPWLKLETRVRDLTENHDHVDVLVGPLYERPMAPLPNCDEPHKVPSHFWAMIKPKGQKPECWVVDQDCERSDAPQTLSIAELEKRTGLQLQ